MAIAVLDSNAHAIDVVRVIGGSCAAKRSYLRQWELARPPLATDPSNPTEQAWDAWQSP